MYHAFAWRNVVILRQAARPPSFLDSARPLLRRVVDVLLRLLAVFLATSLCSFITVGQPVLRVLYISLASLGDFVFHVTSFWDAVSDLVLYSYGLSMLALVTAIALALVLGVLAGFVTGSNPRSLLSRLVRGLSYLGTMTPNFLLALFIMIFFVLYVLPATGIRFILLSSSVTVFDPRRLVPVALTLCVRPLAYFATVAASATAQAVDADYVRAARSRGLSERQILLYHVWPNVLPAVLDAIPVAFLFSVSSLPIVEFVFNWPGLGMQLLVSIVGRPRPGVPPAVLVSFLLAGVGITYILSVLGVEALRLRIDPRARIGETQ